MMCSSSCARSNPARSLSGLLVWSLSIRRSAASTRSRARSKSATVEGVEGIARETHAAGATAVIGVRVIDYEQRVAVRGRTHDGLGGYVAAGTWPVLNEELLTKAPR